MAKFFHACKIPNTCGINVLSQLRKSSVPGGYPISTTNVADVPGLTHNHGAGWLIVGYVSDATAMENHGDSAACCKEAYEEMKVKYKMMDQYPVRANENTGNKFFFVIYDTKSKLGPQGRAGHNAQFKWPF